MLKIELVPDLSNCIWNRQYIHSAGASLRGDNKIKRGGGVAMYTFDNFAEHYDKWFETCLGKFVADCERELILELAGPKSGEKILDVGIGTGFFASEILKYQVDIIGMDVSEKMLDIARSKGLTNVFTGDAAAIDFPDEAFDLVMSITAFEFFREPEKSLSDDEGLQKRRKGGGRDSRFGFMVGVQKEAGLAQES